MIDWRDPAEWRRVIRYYQAGIVNTLFGYGLFSLLVWFGLNMYLAQVIAHVVGVAFNYLTYSRYAFAQDQASVSRFILSYAVNYLLSILTLWAFSHFVTSPYLAGLLSTVVVSLLNFVILKKYVFTPVAMQ